MYQIITDPATGNFCLFDAQKGKTTATAPATSHPHRRARRAAMKYPQLTERLWKAAELVTAGNVRPLDAPPGDIAQVKSETDPQTIYHIQEITDPDGRTALSCTCPDYARGRATAGNQTVCKHVLACFLQSWQDTSGKPPAAAPLAALAEAKPPAKLPRDMTPEERDRLHVEESIERQRNLSKGSQRWQEYRKIAAANGQGHLMPEQSGRFTR